MYKYSILAYMVTLLLSSSTGVRVSVLG